MRRVRDITLAHRPSYWSTWALLVYVTLRYLANVTPMNTRVNFGGRLLKIEHVNEGDLRPLYLTLLCTEQKTGGS